MKKIKYDGQVYEVHDLIMAIKEDDPSSYCYKIDFDGNGEYEYLDIEEVKILKG